MKLSQSRRVTLHALLDLMKEIVYDEIEEQEHISRADLIKVLDLKMPSYLEESGKTSEEEWLASILLRKLQDEKRIRYCINIKDKNLIWYCLYDFPPEPYPELEIHHAK